MMGAAVVVVVTAATGAGEGCCVGDAVAAVEPPSFFNISL